MSVSLDTVGHHHMRTDSIEIVAQQLSDIFDINVLIEYFDGDKFIEIGRVVKHEGRPFHSLEDYSGEDYPVQYQLDASSDDAEGEKTHFFYMQIYREMINICLYGWPNKAFQYESYFFKDEPIREEVKEWMREFRLTCKEVFGKLGINKIFCFGGGYDNLAHLDDEAMNMSGSEYEEYVLSGQCAVDAEKRTGEKERKYYTVVNVSDFISGKSRTYAKGYMDVFIDDFADLT